jgi:hypothetical protein
MNRKEENYTLILSVAYLPNIQYFSKLLNYNDIIIEVFDTIRNNRIEPIYHFRVKRTTRLVIPVKRLMVIERKPVIY